MLESVRTTGGQSQGLTDTLKPVDDSSSSSSSSRRWWCCRSRRCIFLFVLFLGVFGIIYYTNIMGMAMDWNPDWWLQHPANSTTHRWLVPSETLNMDEALAEMVNSSITTTSITSATTSTGIRTTSNSSSSNSSSSSSSNSSNSSSSSSSVSVPAETNQSNNDSVPTTPPPYVSPGPYLVEYPYQYHFIMNEPQKCAEQKPFVVLMVPVAPKNRADRDIVRKTWGSESVVLDKVVTVIFQLGLYTGEGGEQLREQLLQESNEHRDLIQSDFVDCYKNLTIKTMVMMEWLDTYCSNASYAMKIDSDMFLNVPRLVTMLSNAPKSNYMTGLVANGGQVLRDPNSKWFLPHEVFPRSYYPRYALGLGYVLTLDLPKKLLEGAKHVKAVYIEDVYLGLCMEHLGINPTDSPDWNYFHVFAVPYNRCTFSKLVATTTFTDADRMAMWADFSKPGPHC
ncbi:beta-1,3-galactosyltransferase 1-like [Solea solea]|uniref:beta-1,3-galactosyltransferase 1-like n=1 Tax=Solea solea TaxID=90069 RepID=UPI00272BE793|nr:beta-1,3-galactosyltransferase 1-like [Solea solea]